jgi:stage II sporulation protein D
VLRVGVAVERDSALVSASGQFRVLAADGAILAVQDAGRPWRVAAADDGRLALTRPDRAAPAVVPAPVTLRPERAADLVTINGQAYRGELVLVRGSAGVTVVNRVPLEAYLRSVVALELGFRAPSDRQAVQAQAVAARTYAIRFRGRREALGFDVYATDADQVYGGVAAEKPEVSAAVSATAGEVVTYRGEPIQALFHSTCGWSTEAAEEVFQNRAPVPYLRAVSDRFGGGPRDYYCAISPRFRWREEWDGATLAAILTRTLGSGGNAALGRITDLTATATTPTGRVAELVVTTTAGRYVVPRSRIREVLRPAPERQLLSTLLQLHVERRDGAVLRVVAAGAGYGHGVGMCQFGAVGRSRAGQDYRDILTTYYQGTRLERIY